MRLLISALSLSLLASVSSFAPISGSVQRNGKDVGSFGLHVHKEVTETSVPRVGVDDEALERRSFLSKALSTAGIGITASFISPSASSADTSSTATTSSAQITSKIFLQLKGLPPILDENGEPSTASAYTEDIITIGLFGNDAPQPVAILEQLVSNSGYYAKCKPKEIRTLQREQLEANKVYNSCMEMQDTKGVNYDLSTVWRVVKDERIDLGAVSGKFVSRENPSFDGNVGNVSTLKHDVEGSVSVRKGNDGGFGFTIYPGTSSATTSKATAAAELDEDNIVIGRVIDGMDVVRRLNDVAVVQSAAGINYKGLSGGNASSKRSAPSRACRYGSTELYCNEFKPLKKILISRTGTV